ncbi:MULTISPECIES: response regulator transcription factor [Aerococcus]|uniref:response regulator transcription factor n=1 Tax=Aerococcus TaxID=1375 RepID=UPI0018A77AE6|nr:MULTISPECIES: response regulator transcription factor [Aerococcus]MCY3035463.1 response regulator transcription factor [Aerococcus sp. Group 2]MCY3038885.1 response regulator transcription factor [Aerococcus sp. Group 2]MCY3041040.1 response regulator transcription factor [Aerococcus sp. Group 2]MCY3042278.1 response regulator transcription factor [Aerococcus sp. Group 2]MDK6520401.1 response regulator transcription factor [Aerococcus urinae]
MKQIMIVEDNDDINTMLKDLLSQDYQIQQAFSGTEAIRLFDQEDIDLVLLDILLPGKKGDEVLDYIRQSSQIPVIMLTALGDKDLVSDYLLKGANDYITKPFNNKEVLARITVQLRQSHQQAKDQSDQVIDFQAIHFDPKQFLIYTDQEAIRLTKIEAKIFHKLLSHPKQIFTKERLYESIWQAQYIAEDNTLNTHLSNLRKKLSQLDPSQDYIETIWGIGVRLARGDQD